MIPISNLLDQSVMRINSKKTKYKHSKTHKNIENKVKVKKTTRHDETLISFINASLATKETHR